MMRPIKLAVLVIAMALASSGVARAQWDADDDYHRGNGPEARQYGYQNGYRDGMKQGWGGTFERLTAYLAEAK